MTNTGQPLPPPSPGSRRARPPRNPGLDRGDVADKPFVTRALWLAFGSLLIIGTAFWGPFNIVQALGWEEWVNEYRQAADEVTALRVDSDNGRTTIVGADTDEISVVADVRRGLFGITETAELAADGVYELEADCPPLDNWRCRVHYDIVVPHDLAVELRGSNGSTTVSGLDGRIIASTSNGSITVERVSGPLSLRTSNGAIVGREVSGSVVDVSTSNGPIGLEFAAPPTAVTARTSNGAVSIGVPEVDGGYLVRTQTSNGSETVDVLSNPASDRSIEARTSNGAIRVFTTGSTD